MSSTADRIAAPLPPRAVSGGAMIGPGRCDLVGNGWRRLSTSGVTAVRIEDEYGALIDLSLLGIGSEFAVRPDQTFSIYLKRPAKLMATVNGADWFQVA